MICSAMTTSCMGEEEDGEAEEGEAFMGGEVGEATFVGVVLVTCKSSGLMSEIVAVVG